MLCFAKSETLEQQKTVKAREGKLKAVISNKQRTAWLHVIKKGHAKNEPCAKDDGNNSAYMCMHHFHPSKLDVNEKGKIALKIGACATMNLTVEALKRKSFKETTSLPRFIQTAEEDTQLQ